MMKLPILLLSILLLVAVVPVRSASFETEEEELQRESETLDTAFRDREITYEQYEGRKKLLGDKLEKLYSRNEGKIRERIAKDAQRTLERSIKPISELPDVNNYVLENRLPSPELHFDKWMTTSNPYPVTTKLFIEGIQRNPVMFCKHVFALTLTPVQYNDDVRDAPILIGRSDNNNYQAFVRGGSVLYRIVLSVGKDGKWVADNIFVYKQKAERNIENDEEER